MTPIETADPSSADGAPLGAVGEDGVTASCPECGCGLSDGAACDCAAAHSRGGRRRLRLTEALDRDLVDLQASALGRLEVRGEVIA